MRAIKFRGVSKETNQFVYGYLVMTKPFADGSRTCWIIPESIYPFGAVSTPTEKFIEVIESTVGQFIDRLDRNGKEIYENDIVQGESWKEPYAMRNKTTVIGRVEYQENYGFCFSTKGINGEYRGLPKNCNTYPNLKDCEVIGNTHETPEVLK